MAGIEATNAAIAAKVSGITLSSVASIVGWLVFAILVLASIGFGIWWWWNRKIYFNKITDFEVIGNNYEPTRRDNARIVKIGSGGFTLLHLQKTKVYRIAFGGRVGRNNYYFFIGKDGYPYNGLLSADVFTKGPAGIVPVITTNPSMRSQYTALEKMIEQLHGEQKTFWDKYGMWIMNIAYVLIIGVIAWLIYKEIATITNQVASLISEVSKLIDKIQPLVQNNQPSGLVKV